MQTLKSGAKSSAALLALTAGLSAAPAFAGGFDYGLYEALFGEPVTTSATGAPQRVSEAPVNMTIITQEEIRRSGAVDIPGVLERLASIDTLRFFRTQVDVSIRGYNQSGNPGLLVLVDGRQVYLDSLGSTDFDLIPVQLNEIRQIEIVRGPNTALFGFNAARGVINIVTYDPSDNRSALEVVVGDTDYLGGSGVISRQFTDTLGGEISVGGLNAEPWDAALASAAAFNQLPPEAIPDARAWQARGELVFTLRPNMEFRLYADSAENASVLRFRSGGENIGDSFFRRFGAQAALETPLGALSGQVFTNRQDFQLDGYVNGIYIGALETRSALTLASLELLTKPAPRHTLRYSAEYRHYTYESRNIGVEGPAGELTTDIYAASAMWNWRFSDAWTITNAVRLDASYLGRNGPNASPLIPLSNEDYETNFTEVSYNGGVVWTPSENDTLRLSLARGVQAPSQVEYGQQVATEGVAVLVGDPELDPSIVYNAELGWDRRLEPINGRLRLAAFWQRQEDIKEVNARLIPNPLTPVPTLTSRNIGESEMIGFEIILEGETEHTITWRLDYSYLDISDDLVINPPAVPVSPERTSPAHTFTAAAGWTRGRFEADALFRYVSESEGFVADPIFRASQFAEIDAFSDLGFRLGYNVTEDFSLALSGRNVLDDETFFAVDTPVDRSFYLIATRRF